MHQILERFLNDWGIKFLQLTGDTPTDRRQQLVDQFNSSPDITVFLLSMAGSSGINLTKPDTVIFYDHDWNPANGAASSPSQIVRPPFPTRNGLRLRPGACGGSGAARPSDGNRFEGANLFLPPGSGISK